MQPKDEIQTYRELEERRAQKRTTFRETMATNSEIKKLEKLSRKMQNFETYSLDAEGLKLKDFTRVIVPKVVPKKAAASEK